VTGDNRFTAVLVGVALSLGLFGYFVGHAGAPTDAELAKAKSQAARTSKKTAEKRAYAAARRRGVAVGVVRGRKAGAAKGKREGKKRVEQAQAGQGTLTGTGTTTGGPGTQQGYSNAPLNGSTQTPQAGTQQGQKLLQQSPDCKNAPPPPPNYHGPVQC
jgi:hypothetical protein